MFLPAAIQSPMTSSHSQLPYIYYSVSFSVKFPALTNTNEVSLSLAAHIRADLVLHQGYVPENVA